MPRTSPALRGLVGESLAEHVRRIRLERAAGALKRTGDRVIDIALSAGYDAHEPFTRAFRAHFGVPPSQWRARPEPIAFPRALCGVHFGADAAVSQFVPVMEDSRMIEVTIETHPSRRLLALPHSADSFAARRRSYRPELDSEVVRASSSCRF